MKKNYLYSITALLMLLFTASCSQEEITSSANSKEGIVTLDVRVPVNTANSRSNVPTIPEGYKLRCILQPVDNEHNPVGDRLVEEVQAGQENITFTFETPEGYNGAMLWADYFKGDDKTADNLYVTTDLKCITYNASATATELFNNDAADAFYGYLMGTGTSIELQRPFTKLTFKASEDYADYTNITITDLPAPTGFNVMSGETTATASDIASGNLAISDGVWFSTYLFAGSNVSTLQRDITFTLSKNVESLNLKMPGTDIPLTRNNNVTATVTPGKDNTTEVTVTFPGGMTDPNKIALGDYINNDGTFSKTYSADKAIAIVFALAEGKTDGYNYGNGKTPEAYAFALNNSVAKAKLSNNALNVGDTEFTIALYTDGYGKASHDKFMSQCASISESSPLLTSFTTWCNDNTLSSEHLSLWYIPTPAQVRDFSGLVLNTEGWTLNSNNVTDLTFPAMDSKVSKAYTTAKGDEICFSGKVDGSATNILASVLTTSNKIAAVQINEGVKTLGGFETSSTGTYALRPVITVFKGIELAK